MSKLVGTFPRRSEFVKARAGLDCLSLPYQVVCPEPGFGCVGVPALVLDRQTYMALYARYPDSFTCSGWVDYRPAAISVPGGPPRTFADDVFGQAAIMVLAPCVADVTKIRLVAHLSGDLTEVFPYLNAEMQEASYNADGPTFTFLDRYRMVSMYARRIAVAKADEIVDAWRTLEMIRCRVNDVWARRGEISPSYEKRAKPPALEIYNRLPKTNCRACGEKTCLAFALRLWGGDASPSQCRPVHEGDYRHLKPAFIEICAGLGVSEPEPSEKGAMT